ncbi:MAG: hypothetical protein E7491_03560 [Ruminococcaceae bacterium]|nr:hypothetical protein [Oscillospiraceae bacterium]
MKKVITVLLAVLFCFAVASCDEGKEEKSLIKTGRDFCAVENGVFFIDNENMKFYDFETRQIVYLCNKANCNHEPYRSETNPLPTCDSVAMKGEGIIGVMAYNNTLYWVMSDMAQKPSVCVYESKLDGSGKKLVTSIDGLTMTNYLPIFCANGKMYLHQKSFENWDAGANEENERERIHCIDLKSGKSECLLDIEAGKGYSRVTSMYLKNNEMYYVLRNCGYDGEEYEYSDMTSDVEIHKLDLQTKEKTILSADGKDDYDLLIGISSEGELIYNNRKGNKQKIYNESNTVIAEYEAYATPYIDGDKLILNFVDGGKSRYEIKSLTTGELIDEFICNTTAIWSDTDKWFISMGTTGGDRTFSVIDKDDFYSGKIAWH